MGNFFHNYNLTRRQSVDALNTIFFERKARENRDLGNLFLWGWVDFNNDKNIKVFALGVLGQASTQEVCDWGY